MHLFLIDYATRRRIKIWGAAAVVSAPDLLARLADESYDATVERGIVIRIDAWDANCRQHIPRLLDADPMERELLERDRRIASLEQELAALRQTAVTSVR